MLKGEGVVSIGMDFLETDLGCLFLLLQYYLYWDQKLSRASGGHLPSRVCSKCILNTSTKLGDIRWGTSPKVTFDFSSWAKYSIAHRCQARGCCCSGRVLWMTGKKNTATQPAMKPLVTGRARRESEDCTFKGSCLIFRRLCPTIDLAISLICISLLSHCSSSYSQFFLNKIETPSIDLDGIITLLLLKSPSIYSKNEAFLIQFMLLEACLERDPEISAVLLDKVKSLGDT